jgi:hypothetical protein
MRQYFKNDETTPGCVRFAPLQGIVHIIHLRYLIPIVENQPEVSGRKSTGGKVCPKLPAHRLWRCQEINVTFFHYRLTGLLHSARNDEPPAIASGAKQYLARVSPVRTILPLTFNS